MQGKVSTKLNMFLMTLVIMTLVHVCYSDHLNETMHVRVKRGKYYSSPPQRFYRRPPIMYPTKGVYSLTPPPGYMMDDDEPPYPGKPKVSRRPEGLGDDDVSNIIKYLSKQDLDKIIEFAGQKERIKESSVENRPFKREESGLGKANVQEFTDQAYSPNGSNQKYNLNGPFRSQERDSQLAHKQSNSDQFAVPPYYQSQGNNPFFSGPYALNDDLQNYVEEATLSKVFNANQANGDSNALLKTEESMQNKQISYMNAYIHHEMNDMTPGSGPANVFTDNHIMMTEDTLPKPLNLREDDFDISYTNNVPAVVKGPSYEVKNFGDLPLMSNNYKLDTVSSYKVPHYTVTSNSKYGAPSSSSQSVPIEPAPPVSEAQDHSDAHLKAIKIWTHRSQGTAYTLHKDGTLSLERPAKPKTKYGP